MRIPLDIRLDYRVGVGIIVCMLLVGNNCEDPGPMDTDDTDDTDMTDTRPVPDGSNLLVNPGFETLDYRIEESPIVPTGTGYWQGDFGQIVEGTQADGVAPDEGSRMLRCDGSTPVGGGADLLGCEVFQIVDVSGYADRIDSGEISVSGSVRVNRVDVDAETDTDFLVRIFALGGPPGDVPTEWTSPLDRWDTRRSSDGDVATWEEMTISPATLPTGTRTLMIMLSPIENVFDDAGADEFDGHYLEAASLSLACPGCP